MLASLFDHPIWHRWVLALIHFLWQGSLVAIVWIIALRALRIRTAQGRYAASLAALGAMIVCPVITFMLVDSKPMPIARQDSITAAPVSSNTTEGLITAAMRDASHDEGMFASAHEPGAIFGDAITRYQRWIASLWLMGVVVLSLRLILGFAALHRIRRSRSLPPPRLMQSAARLAQVMGLSKAPRVYGCRRIVEPAAAGFWRPIILVPAAWMAHMPGDMLEAIIAHELAHIRRHDLWINLMQRIAEAVFFFHPAIWWLSARLREDREVCCDDLAVAATQRKLAYANTLEFVARQRLARVQPTLAMHIGGPPMTLLHRVRNVLGITSATSPVHRGWIGGVAALAVPVMLAGASLLATPAATVQAQDRAEKPRERERDGEVKGREGERPAPPPRREGERPREGDRPREGERVREGERPREGDRERPVPPRGEGDRRPEGEARPPLRGGEQEELMRTIRELRAEVDRLRREVAELRESRNVRPLPPREAERREVERRETDRREVERREGDRPLPPRDIERREVERREIERREIQRREAERREGDRPRPDREREEPRRDEKRDRD